jgi:hypothetical protein
MYVLGGNSSTLAFVSDVRPVNRQIHAFLIPLAWTPAGVVLGEGWQRVSLAADNLAGWIDSTFPPDEERTFVGSARDFELLLRAGWSAEAPETLSEEELLNPEEVPEDVLDAFSVPPQALTQCAVCRRMCVRDHFAWNDRQLCAWDYHAIVFGKRGPWRSEPYEERLFATLPAPKYVAPGLLDELGVEPIAILTEIDLALMRGIVNEVIAADATRAYLAVHTGGGLTVLREREPAAQEEEPASAA